MNRRNFVKSIAGACLGAVGLRKASEEVPKPLTSQMVTRYHSPSGSDEIVVHDIQQRLKQLDKEYLEDLERSLFPSPHDEGLLKRLRKRDPTWIGAWEVS